MVSNSRVRTLALVSGLVGVVNLVVLGYRLWSFQPGPDDGGTDVAGLGFFIVLVLALMVLAEALVAIGFVRWLPPSEWARRLTAAGLLATALGALGVTVWHLAPLVGFEWGTPRTVDGIFWVLVVGGGGIGLGLVVELVTRYRTRRTDTASS